MSKSVGTNSRVTAQKPSGVIINSADTFVLPNTHTHILSFLMNNHIRPVIKQRLSEDNPHAVFSYEGHLHRSLYLASDLLTERHVSHQNALLQDRCSVMVSFCTLNWSLSIKWLNIKMKSRGKQCAAESSRSFRALDSRLICVETAIILLLLTQCFWLF